MSGQPGMHNKERKKRVSWADEMAHLVRCLSHKHEDLSSTPTSHTRSQAYGRHQESQLWRCRPQRKPGPAGPSPHTICDLQSPPKALSQKMRRMVTENNIQDDLWGTHTHTQMHLQTLCVCVCMHTHTHAMHLYMNVRARTHAHTKMCPLHRM